LLNTLGNGAVAPFLVIYLHDVRGIPLGVAGLAGSTGAACGLFGALAAGAVADRAGARRTMFVGLLLSTTAYFLYPAVREAWQAFVLAGLAGSGLGTWLTMQSTVLASIAPPELRHVAFAQQRVAANLGLGFGGFLGGLLVTTSDPASFTRLFLFNAVTFLAYSAFVLWLPDVETRREGRRVGGYGTVLRDHALRGVALVQLLLVAGAVSLLVSLFPVFARNDAGVSEWTIGLVFLLNSLFIIFAQVPVARAHEGHRRMTGLAATAGLFALAWMIVLLTPSLTVSAAAALLVLAVLVFALGECLYDTVEGPLVADLAPESLRGSYMAVNGIAWQLGFIAGPGIGGLLLGWSGTALWLAAAGVCVTAGLLALALEVSIPHEYRITPVRA